MNTIKKNLAISCLTVITITTITACATRQKSINTTIETLRDSVVIERLIYHALPDDSATVSAVLRCDSMGRVYIAQIEALESRNLSLHLMLDSMGRMKQKVYHTVDTIRLPQTIKETKILKTSSTDKEEEKKSGSRCYTLLIGLQWGIIATIMAAIFIRKIKSIHKKKITL